jgi:hypothetical protein
MSSSSDDGWMPKMSPTSASAGTGQSSMMDARRRALQQQREAQQRRHPIAGRRESPTTFPAAPAKKAESALPDFLAGLDDDDDGDVVSSDHATIATATALNSPSQPTQIFPMAGTASSFVAIPSAVSSTPLPTHEVAVEELQRQIAAKRKQLQLTTEREAALVEKWRATKAQKQAEVEQLSANIRRVWAAVEDEKSAAETKIREAQDRHEAELRAARRSVEQAVKAEYDAKIAEAQKQLSSAKAEEERLRQLLEEKGGSAAAKDTVVTALTAAITAVMHKLDDVFQSEAAEGLRMEAWKSELQSEVQREIQTSFAVGVESETQAERGEYERFFSEMLAFWRTAEDQERERLLKMDEALLTDLQSMAQQDLKRLQDEELAMERVYVESREAWAAEHQKLLQRELEGALQRREVELQEQRRQYHELHVERLRDVDARHKDVMAKEEALHQQRMEQLRAFFHREEDLRAEQQRIELAAQESVTQLTSVLKGVMASTEETVSALKEYEHSIEESRRQVEVACEQHALQQEQLLEKMQDLAATQCSNTDAERAALEECAAQLRLTTQTMDRHLQDEAAWLAQQESTYHRNRDEWEREYRRWQQLVQQERQVAEERFHEALAGLQQSLQLLDVEERDVAVERASLQRTFAEVEAAAQREVEALQRRAADVQSRSLAMAEMQTRLGEQRNATAEAQRQLLMAQKQLEEEKADLRVDEERLRDMMEALRVARSRATLRGGSNGNGAFPLLQSSGVGQQLQQLLHGTATFPHHGNVRLMGGGTERNAQSAAGGAARAAMETVGGPQLSPRESGVSQPTDVAVVGAATYTGTVDKKRRHRSDPNRLPNKILRELSDELHHLTAGGSGAGEALGPTMHWADRDYLAVLHQQHSHQQHRDRVTGPRKGRRQRAVPSSSNDIPPPLSASPQSVRRERWVRSQHMPSPIPQQQQKQQRSHRKPQQHARHVDPSSLPLTSESSPPLSLRNDNDWSPSANTFTNLLDFSDADTTSQSFR